MLQNILGPDPKTTLGGILLALGLAATKASTFGLPQWVDFGGAMVAAAGGALLGKSAVDGGRLVSIQQGFRVDPGTDPDKLAQLVRDELGKQAAARKDVAQ